MMNSEDLDGELAKDPALLLQQVLTKIDVLITGQAAIAGKMGLSIESFGLPVDSSWTSTKKVHPLSSIDSAASVLSNSPAPTGTNVGSCSSCTLGDVGAMEQRLSSSSESAASEVSAVPEPPQIHSTSASFLAQITQINCFDQ